MLQVSASQMAVKYHPQKPRIVQEIEVEMEESKRMFKMEGSGEWQSLDMFKYLHKKGGIQSIHEE